MGGKDHLLPAFFNGQIICIMKRNVFFIGGILFLLISLSSYGQTKTDSLHVLFIGNSYTHFNDMPETVRKIASTQQVNLACTQFTPGGFFLSRHVKNEELIQAIKKGGWDYVIIQEQSAAPSMPTETVLQNTYPPAHTLDSLIRVYNQQAKVIFYMTWGHKDGCQDEVHNYPLNSTYEGMQERLKTSYLEMAYQNDAWCAPAGMAWKWVRAERPDYILYMPDRSHPSVLGSYLVANVIFCTIYQRPYQTQETSGCPAEQAEYIQQVAQQTVLTNLKLLNIEK